MSTDGNEEKTGAALTESRRRLFLVLPIAFHALGPGMGKLFLPMYYPVLALGLLASWEVALIVGMLIPVLSSILTGMPPPPMAVMMALELGAIGAVASLVVASLVRSWRGGIWPAAIAALVAARIIGIAAILTILPMIGIQRGIYEYVIAGFIASLPGEIILLTVVPATVYAIEKTSMIGSRHVK